MVRGGAPHAVLLIGPAGIGKTTLATDLAAGLLCAAADPAARPCGSCRACRLVAHGSHPDVHRLGPEGPGRQIVIGGPGAKVRGIRDLITDLVLMPVEGGARVAIVESAQRMNEDAQAALLKTLEEPPAGVTIILSADAEEPLLPTIRSRTARLRLGPVAVRDIEAILADAGVADPPLAARLGRISNGRPGLAMAWARDPDALRDRDELARILLDLLDARASERLAAIRAAGGRAVSLGNVTEGVVLASGPEAVVARRHRGSAAAAGVSATTVDPEASAITSDAGDDAARPSGQEAEDAIGPARAPAVERPRAASALVELWTDVPRDLIRLQHGLTRSVRDLGLLDDMQRMAARVDPAMLTAFLDRLGRAAVLLRSNVSPDLVLDDLALNWSPAGQTTAA